MGRSFIEDRVRASSGSEAETGKSDLLQIFMNRETVITYPSQQRMKWYKELLVCAFVWMCVCAGVRVCGWMCVCAGGCACEHMCACVSGRESEFKLITDFECKEHPLS